MSSPTPDHADPASASNSRTELSEVAAREESILAFWHAHDIFHKSIKAPAGRAPQGDFVFYDGPPFATGLPHYGHILAGTIKDAIPRFWTMRGYRVRRKWGWDCHGLPLENLIEKRLGLATKRDIEAYGVQNFNEAARAAVLEYADDWKRIIPRMGRWADMEDDYRTMDSSYTESVWWVFKSLHERGLVFEGFKGMHLCPRCGTTLSNFEVNQGYKDIKDIAVTVKLPLLDEAGQPSDTSLLVWTTTPWTLPGNLAAAVHEEYEYVKCEVTPIYPGSNVKEDGTFTAPEGGHIGKTEYLILAKGRLAQIETESSYLIKVVETFKGSELVGKKYEPPFPWLKEQDFAGKENAWQILHADYVELGEEGTGAVHLAPAYGEDDLNLAKAHDIPIVHHVSESGHFMNFVRDFAGQLVKPKDDDEAGVSHLDADIEVVKALKATGRLLKKENITHSYPHCWRCDTPLLNYATTSWFVAVTEIKDQLVAENARVHWVPEHVGKNRFGKWLEGARDWAVSRQRYWGAPLPIWRNPETGAYKLFGSLAELQAHTPQSGNRYLITRHAESLLNTQETLNVQRGVENGLTERGQQQIAALVEQLAGETIDYIYYSPLQRTAETAQAIAQALTLEAAALVADERLLEVDFGVFEGQTVDAYHAYFANGMERLTKRPEGGEHWNDVRRRVGSLLYELDTTLRGKTVLFVSHNGTLQMLQAVAAGDSATVAGAHIDDNSYDLENAELRELLFTPLPHNDEYELDFHRPYIDTYPVYEGAVRLERIPDVFDCWFESGSMPYGQHHYPFACNEETFLAQYYPANFIAEGLDQTRGWFYSLIVLGTALFGKSPYQNVIVNGLVLAEDGKKMSKSLQNYPDPMELADRTGVDAMRLYLLSSPIMHGEDLNFSEQEVLELQRKNIGRLHNVLAMYELYADGTAASRDSDQVLDRWIISRLDELIIESTAGFERYELDRATRPIVDFIDDLSVWYVRRSRDRLKGENATDKAMALATLRYVLDTLARVIAPAMPFYAEYLWQRVKGEAAAESVHLAEWPTPGEIDAVVLGEMSLVREFVTTALEARTKAGIKVRQPLAALTLNIELEQPYADILADEVNVKSVKYADAAAERVVLDTTITPELQAEGDARELMRAIQTLRKQAGLAPQDRIQLTIATDQAGRALITQFEAEITRVTGTVSMDFSDEVSGVDVTAGAHHFQVALTPQ